MLGDQRARQKGIVLGFRRPQAIEAHRLNRCGQLRHSGKKMWGEYGINFHTTIIPTLIFTNSSHLIHNSNISGVYTIAKFENSGEYKQNHLKITQIQPYLEVDMKKTLILVTVLALAAALFISAAPVLAADLDRGGPGGNGGGGAGGNGGGGNGQQGSAATGTGIPLEQNINLDGSLDVLLHENMAVALGITPEELAARMDAGETFADVALSLGFDYTTISEMLSQARADALAQAVLDGTITQEQADWLASTGNTNPAASYGDSACLADGTCDGTFDMLQQGQRRGQNR